MTPPGFPLVEEAPAKVNLTLRVRGRRPDGYHEIESLVVFAEVGDRVTLAPGRLGVTVDGPFAAAIGQPADNLILKAVRELASRITALSVGRFVLSKHLPVASGIGGGSSDAAAALRLLARANAIAADDERLYVAARATGADVPVCLDPRPRLMSGVGEILSAPLSVPKLPAVLVNPGRAVSTKEVFAALAAPPLAGAAVSPNPASVPHTQAALVSWLAHEVNDLEKPAIAVEPVIADVLAALRALPGCHLARMSGSGATCFGVFETPAEASVAAEGLHAARPAWWVCATRLG